eukprot:COSAG02_NODE_61211_length_269_cov_0.611765_1_plen_73_part_01
MALPLLLASQACCSIAVAAGANPGGNSSLLGILNATSCAGVDSTGKTDSTVALQGCIERAYKANLALFFAPGR